MEERLAYFIAFARARMAHDLYGNNIEVIRDSVLERIGDATGNYDLANKVALQVTGGQEFPDGVTRDNMLDGIKFIQGLRRVD